MRRKKVNILFFIDMLESIGGTEKHLFQLVTSLDRNKFSCMVCPFAPRDSEIIRKIKGNGISVIPIPVSRYYSFNAYWQAFKIRKLIRENKIDIVQTFHFQSDTYGVIVSKLSGVGHIISSRRDTGDLKKPLHIFLNRAANKFIDVFIVVANAIGNRIKMTEGVHPAKIITIYNGVNETQLNFENDIDVVKKKAELGISAESFVIGKVAWFRPEKGYQIFFEAIKKVKPFIKDLKVLAVGSGVLRGYFEQYCENNGLRSTVIFKVTSNDKIKELISVMDIACLTPISNEGLSNAILEEMALARPVIATSVGGNAELVVDGETGIIVPPNDPNRLADAMIKLYKNPELRKAMGAKGRERVKTYFTLERMLKKMEDLYISLMEEKNN